MKVRYELTPEEVKKAIREYFGLNEKATVTFNIEKRFIDRMETQEDIVFTGVEVEADAAAHIKKKKKMPQPAVSIHTPSQLELLGH